MASPQEASKPSRRRRIALAVILAILIIIALLLSKIRCDKPVNAAAFDYFDAKALSLGRDAGQILKFVRDDVRALPYRGDVKGALGSLWENAGSPEEKVALANALLAHASAPRTVGLDDVAPARDKAADPTDAKYKLTIAHRLLLADGPKDTPIFTGPIGSLVGDVHTIDMPDADTTRFTLRGPGGVAKTVSHAGALGEEIVFTVERPGDKPVTVVRELWHKDNRAGRREPMAGERHDFVILPCRVSQYVREKEEVLLKQRARDKSDEAAGYLALLDYAKSADALLGKLEKSKKVQAQFELPRILILSRYNFPDGSAYAIDLRLDRTAFAGPRTDAYLASQMRSFIEAGMEQHFLADWSGLPTSSAYDVFCQLKDDFPNSQPRRLAMIVDALAALGQYGGPDGKATFRARPPDGKDAKGLPTVVATRAGGGAVRVQGGPVNADFARSLAAAKINVPYAADGRLDARFDSLTEAALAVETTLLAGAAKGGVSPMYVLDANIDCGTEPLVAPDARFHFAWGEGDTRTDQRIHVTQCSVGLELAWRVQDSARPVSGARTIGESAMTDAVVHNPWYRAGANSQDSVTSFCVSRKVYDSLKAGKPVEMALQGRYTAKDDPEGPRPIEWKGSVAPAGGGTCRVKINGQDEDVRVLKCTLGTAPVAILDDGLFPVGMADKLVDVWTSIRGRLVDEKGIGIGGATVQVGEEDGGVTAQTWPDGGFRLPPGPTGGYGKVKLKVTRNELVLGAPEADLTAPGRKPVTITVPRDRKELAFIGPSDADQLKALPLSDQVKRHALNDLAAGNTVVIPNKMVALAPGLSTIAYFALDVPGGNIVGVMENGLNGSNTGLDRTGDKAMEEFGKAVKAKLGPPSSQIAYVHMYRGANTAAWLYCSHRLEGMEHTEAILALLEEMDGWEKATNMMENFGDAAGKMPWTRDAGWNSQVGDKLKDKLGDLLDAGAPGTNDDAAKFAFKFGYLCTCAGLATQLEGS
jgi:hypothetical protein